MRRPNYIGYNPNKFRYPSSVQQSHDHYKDKTMRYTNYRGGADDSQDVLPSFDRTNLVAYWPFINDLNDYGPNGFHWTLSSSSPTTGHRPLFLPAQRNKALYLSNTRYRIEHNAAWAWGTSNFTLMFWHHVNHQQQWGLIGSTSSSRTAGLISKRSSDSDSGWEFYNNGSSTQTGRMNFRIVSTDLVSTDLVPSNTWTHWAVVRTGTGSGQTILYKNGIVDKTGTYATNMVSTSYIQLGKSILYGQYNRGSSIQHFMAFSRALTNVEILAFINQTGQRFTDLSEF